MLLDRVNLVFYFDSTYCMKAIDLKPVLNTPSCRYGKRVFIQLLIKHINTCTKRPIYFNSVRACTVRMIISCHIRDNCRYMAIVRPLQHRMSHCTARSAVAVIWVASAMLAFPCLLYSSTMVKRYSLVLVRFTNTTFNITVLWYIVITLIACISLG